MENTEQVVVEDRAFTGTIVSALWKSVYPRIAVGERIEGEKVLADLETFLTPEEITPSVRELVRAVINLLNTSRAPLLTRLDDAADRIQELKNGKENPALDELFKIVTDRS